MVSPPPIPPRSLLIHHPPKSAPFLFPFHDKTNRKLKQTNKQTENKKEPNKKHKEKMQVQRHKLAYIAIP